MGSSFRYTSQVIGPDGDVLTWAKLPPQDTKRWVPRRKAEVIAAVQGGLISMSDACMRYAISNDEFCTWVRAYERFGLSGLRARQARLHSTPPESEQLVEAHSKHA
jgi:transposase-like protein